MGGLAVFQLHPQPVEVLVAPTNTVIRQVKLYSCCLKKIKHLFLFGFTFKSFLRFSCFFIFTLKVNTAQGLDKFFYQRFSTDTQTHTLGLSSDESGLH